MANKKQADLSLARKLETIFQADVRERDLRDELESICVDLVAGAACDDADLPRYLRSIIRRARVVLRRLREE